jgi:hypothetical protein
MPGLAATNGIIETLDERDPQSKAKKIPRPKFGLGIVELYR